jgi:hypothetical protein
LFLSAHEVAQRQRLSSRMRGVPEKPRRCWSWRRDFCQQAQRKFTPQTSVQFDYGPSVDEAEEERSEMDFLAAPECFVKVAAETQERVFLTVSRAPSRPSCPRGWLVSLACLSSIRLSPSCSCRSSQSTRLACARLSS